MAARYLQIKALEHQVTCLRAKLNALTAEEAPDIYPAWAEGMARQTIELVHLLVRAYPRTLTSEYLLDNISHTSKKEFVSEDMVKTHVCRARKRMGKDSIVTQHCIGYSATSKLVDIVRPKKG